MPLTTFHHSFAVMMFILAIIAMVALVSPQTLGQLMTGRPVRKTGWKPLFVRIAAVLVLIGAAWWAWLKWLRIQ